MGCGQSKIENEEAVTRYKDRKQFMKDAVSARNAFAAAHSAYAMSLKNTGAALSDYAHGEVQNSASTNAAVPATEGVVAPPLPPPQPPFELDPPPPPPPNASFETAPLQRAATMPEMKMPDNKKPAGPSTILEEEGDGDDEVEAEDDEKLVRRRRRGYKGSGSVGGSSSSSRSRDRLENDPSPISASPAVVETRAAAMQAPQSSHGWEEYLFPPQENMVGPNLGAVEEEEEEEEKQQKVFDEMPKRVDEVVEEVSTSTKVETAPVEKVPIEIPATTGGRSVGKSVKKGKAGVGAASSGAGEKRLVKGTANLLWIFEQLDDHFLRASESAHEVSKMLEATRLHYHSNFADNRGNDLRNKLISVIMVKH